MMDVHARRPHLSLVELIMGEKNLFKAISGQEKAFPGREKVPGKMQHGAPSTNGACRRSPLAHDVFSCPQTTFVPCEAYYGREKPFQSYFRTRKSFSRSRKDAREDAARRSGHKRGLQRPRWSVGSSVMRQIVSTLHERSL